MPHRIVAQHDRVRWVLTQAVIVTGAIFIYFQVRGVAHAEPTTAVAHGRDLQALESRLGIDIESALQAPLLDRPGLEGVANWIYIWGHWPVIVCTLAWLAWRHRSTFVRMRDAMVVSGAMGLVVFVSFPVAPPRLADGDVVDTITLHSQSYRVLQPPNFVNQYAALPSLHAGWDLLVGLAIVTAATWTVVRVAAALLPVLMAYAVVATGNHYVIDVVVGLAFALVGYLVAILLERRRRPREGSP